MRGSFIMGPFRQTWPSRRPDYRLIVSRLLPVLPGLFFPMDEELELLPGELSVTLTEGVARLGTKMPFAPAAAELAYFRGVELDATTVRPYTEAALSARHQR